MGWKGNRGESEYVAFYENLPRENSVWSFGAQSSEFNPYAECFDVFEQYYSTERTYHNYQIPLVVIIEIILNMSDGSWAQRRNRSHKGLQSCTVHVIRASTWESGLIWHDNQELHRILGGLLYWHCSVTLSFRPKAPDLFNWLLNGSERRRRLTFLTPCQASPPEGHVWRGSKCQPQQIRRSLSRPAWSGLVTAPRRGPRILNGNLGLLGDAVSSERSGAGDYKCLPAPPPPRYATLPAHLGGFRRHWRRAGTIQQRDKRGACGLGRRVFLDILMHACIGGSARLQTAPPLISSQSENDPDSPGCWMCLHTRNTNDIVSQRAALAATRRDALCVTKAPIHLPLGWNTLQSLRSPAVLWRHPWWC